ncbi:MAG: hypothetical protein NTW86_23565, partial [Candidatus Sumerlaeota bacterium]|nr:hypothetical protein [Candidatus Sumerlaeota bacterium]
MSDLLHLISSIRVADVLDIALVSAIFFALFRLLLESRSRVALEGLLTVLMLSFFVYFLSRVFGLNAMQLIFERFWIIAVLAALIVFQHEFRRVLTDIGQL